MFDNTNRRSLFKNNRKQSETHADFNGSINIDGVDYWIDGWHPKPGGAENGPVLQLKVRPKVDRTIPPRDGAFTI